MGIWIYAAATSTFVASTFLTWWTCRIASAVGVIDTPNERSSHSVPTPRGGGLAIVISSLAAIGVLAAAGIVGVDLLVAVGGGGAAVASSGLLDDYRTLSARTRLTVHLLAGAWAVFWIGPSWLLFAGWRPVLVTALAAIISTVGIAGFLNVFNFMDGIDGVAAAEAAFVCASAALLATHLGGVGLAAVALILAAAAGGFLVWNWAPAKIFMGDVGSGYLGFMLGVLAVFGLKLGPTTLCTWLILAGIFVVDGGITLMRRMCRGEALATAHRMHGYQHAAVRFGHARVTAAVIMINVAWLLPLAIASALRPDYAIAIMVLALAPIAGLAVFLGAGCPEGVVA